MANGNPGSGRNQSGSGNSARKARETARAEREAAQAAAKRRRTVTTVVVAVVVVAIVAALGGLVAWQRNKSDPTAAAPRNVVPSYSATASPAASGSATPSASAGAGQSSVDAGAARQSKSTAAGMGWGVGAGKATAPVTLELFEDFSCPHCAELETTLGAQLKAAVAANSVKVIYYPLTLSGFGRPTELAANAFACAADAGKAEEFHDALYANYDTAAQQWTNSMLTDIGKSVGLTSSDFGRCVRGDTFNEWVKSIDDTGDDRSVTGTPTAYVNGTLVPAASMSGDGIMQAVAAAALAAK